MALPTVSESYIAEWMTSVGLIQADLSKLLGYSKAKASAIWNREQRVNEDILKEIAPLVHAKPYELLMPVERAMRLRRLEEILDRGVPQDPPAQSPAASDKVTPLRRRNAG